MAAALSGVYTLHRFGYVLGHDTDVLVSDAPPRPGEVYHLQLTPKVPADPGEVARTHQVDDGSGH